MAKKTANESILREKPGKAPRIKVTGDKRFKSLKSVSIISGDCDMYRLESDHRYDAG